MRPFHERGERIDLITGNWLLWLLVFLVAGAYMVLGTVAAGLDALFSGGRMSSMGGKVSGFRYALIVFIAAAVPLVITIVHHLT